MEFVSKFINLLNPNLNFFTIFVQAIENFNKLGIKLEISLNRNKIYTDNPYKLL